MTNLTVGERIKARRIELKISVDALAAAAGVNRSTIYHYEKGDIKKIPWDVLWKIAKKLDMSPEELLDAPPEYTPPMGEMYAASSNLQFPDLPPEAQDEAAAYHDLLRLKYSQPRDKDT